MCSHHTVAKKLLIGRLYTAPRRTVRMYVCKCEGLPVGGGTRERIRGLGLRLDVMLRGLRVRARGLSHDTLGRSDRA